MIRATKFGPQEAFASPEWQRTGVAFVFPITLTRGPDQFMVYIGRDHQPWKGPIKDRVEADNHAKAYNEAPQ